jgi:histidinol phosphatase-like enzyme (inositol monophosphatase family)
MSESMSTLMQGASELARLAGDIAHGFFRRDVVVETKTDGSPVTIADRRAEEFAREWIAQHFPRDGILGEELGLDRPEAARQWIIDPIDGTKAFIRGVPLWGTLVAVAEGPHVLAGAAAFPAVNEHLAAGVGTGCWWNDERCTVSVVDDIGAATVLTTSDRFPGEPTRRTAWYDLTTRAAVYRTWGDCYGYLLVATGRAEVMVDNTVRPWDIAAFAPILAEAGGRLTDWQGAPTAFGGSAIATNQTLARDVRRILGVPLEDNEPRRARS